MDMRPEDAYSDFFAKAQGGRYYRFNDDPMNRPNEEGEATRQQTLDVLADLHGRPISSWMIFRAGWDCAMRCRQGKSD